ncbi:MAG: class I SAM-dependent methyltransferase [Acidobacteriota bacterium]|nr:class I SAM-dependent methyltransferase [Acidobacteriota bacterium]
MGFDAGQFWEKRLARLTNLEGVGCEGRSAAWNRILYRTKVRALNRVLKRFRLDPAGQAALDIGCGVGFWIDTLHHLKAGPITGVDIAASAVNHCRERFAGIDGLDFKHGDFGAPDFDADAWSERFQLVTSFDVFYHITDRTRFETALANVAKVMKPGGWFLVSDTFGRETMAPQEHVVFRGLDVYRQCLTDVGLETAHVEPVTVFLNSPLDGRGLYGKLLHLLYYKVTNKLTRKSGSDDWVQRCWLAWLYHCETVLLAVFPAAGKSNRLLVAHKPG